MSTTLVFFPVSGDYQSPDDPEAQSSTSAPTVEAVMGLVTFTPRVPKGFQAFIANYQIAQNSNCQQTVSLIGALTGGTWALEFNGLWTAAIPASPTAAQIQSALAALANVGTGNVVVTAVTPNPGYPSFLVQFIGTLANQPLPQMTADPSNLTTSSGSAGVTVVMLQPGATSRVGPAVIAFPPRQGRIWTTGQLCSINVVDSPNVELLADMPELGLGFPLIYDVTFSAVQYADAPGALAPFAFTAPADTTPVSITDPALAKLPYQPPIAETWTPGWVPGTTAAPNVTGIHDWRKAG
jgi:hypothetical protein